MTSFVEYGIRYYCEVDIPLPKSWGFSRSYSIYDDFEDDGIAINCFLAEHSRRVNRIYMRRAQVIYNVLLHAYEKEWVTVPIYTRIDK